jgi:hypothetical protein
MLAALALAAPLSAEAQGRVRVVVMDLEPASPELKSAAGVLTGVVLDELGRAPHIAALGSSEIAALLGLERQRALLGCDAGSDCLAEMGNALGAKYVLRGTVGALGRSLRLDLTLLDTARAGAAAREGGTASREEDLEAEARSAVRRLAFAVRAPASPAAPAGSAPAAPTGSAGGHGPWPWVLTGGGAALAAAGGAGIGWAWSVQAAFDAQQLGNPQVSTPTVSRADAARAVTLYPFAWGTAAGGAAAAAAGIVWLLIPAPPPGTARLVPVPGGAAVQIDL